MQDKNVDKNGSIILEKEVQFSKSLLWSLQKAAYVEFGMQAWTEKGVPFYLTSNPHTAKEYVQIALGYFQDCLGHNAKTPFDLSSPIYIFDLGAGSGRFAFLFLKYLTEGLIDLGLKDLKIRYVITDFVEENLNFCASHPQMLPYINKGVLDFALYDHSQTDQSIELKLNKEKLNGPLKNPAILIANYFFDTIPQDLFKVVDGKLMDGKITLSLPKDAVVNSIDNIDPKWIGKLSASYSYVPHHPKDFKVSNSAQKVLKEYGQEFECVPFLFPTGAFQSIEFFRQLTNDRFLLLAGDQGVCTEEQIKTWGEPHIARHGSFSIAVSYHALKRYFENTNGFGLLTSLPDPLFVVIAAVLGGKKEEFRQVNYAFKNSFEAFEPSDYWKLVGSIVQDGSKPSLELLLTLIKLGNWDPVNLNTFFESIRSQIPQASANEKALLVHAIENIWQNFYPVSADEGAFIMNLGILHFEMKRIEDALTYFQRAEALSGSTPLTRQNIGVCKRLL